MATAPFSRITNQHWMPAIDSALASSRANIAAITANPEPATFANTIVALERANGDLNHVLPLFFALTEANSNDEMMQISLEASAKLSEHSTALILNKELWQRVKSVYDGRQALGLNPEDSMLLQQTYDAFALSGANLEGEDRETFKRISAELSELTTLFGQNVQRELPTYHLDITDLAEVAGLPQSQIDAAAEAAAEAGLAAGTWRFTLDAPVYQAFMKYVKNRPLREKMWRLYNGRNQQGQYSNLDNIRRITDLRLQLGKLLGKDTYAAHSLTNTMAQNPANVYNLLEQLRKAYTPALKAELEAMTAFAAQMEGDPELKIMPWDYSYYANAERAAKYAFDEEALRPYFELNSVIDGVFGLATRLYGLQFKERKDIDVYHPDVKAFEVTDADGKDVGILYTDFFPRPSKRPGAWMTNFKEQWREADGSDSRPQVSIVMNFTKPTATTPSLLTPYEVETFLHEFGHSLHGLLADSKYSSLSGTNVYRDFVELPSQFNENYLTQREWLDTFARHYQTGEAIPDSLVNAMIASQQFGAAYACMRQLGFGYLDMAWHTITEPVTDVAAFESQATDPVRIFADVEGSIVSPTFSHIFAGGYAAGYYSYKWAEVLDADAFEAFREAGIFDPATARSFRDNILRRGGTENPAVLYRRFRGADPSIDALLRRDGILLKD